VLPPLTLGRKEKKQGVLNSTSSYFLLFFPFFLYFYFSSLADFPSPFVVWLLRWIFFQPLARLIQATVFAGPFVFFLRSSDSFFSLT